MSKRSIRLIYLFVIAALVAILPLTALAAPPYQEGDQQNQQLEQQNQMQDQQGQQNQMQAVACEQQYTVQAGDWLSTIADQFYNDVLAYPAIVQATNAQADTGQFQRIDNPATIEIGWQLCIPSQADAQAMLNQMNGQMGQQQMAQTGEQYDIPEGQMLLVMNNFSKANAPSTFTITGGNYGGGEQITVNPGEEVQLQLEPAHYRVVWSTPAADPGVVFGRQFDAVPGTLATARIIPEKEQAFFNMNVQQQQMQEQQAQQQPQDQQMQQQQTDTAQVDREFPYEAPQSRGLLVFGNRSLADIPSTLTITGGQFGGGEQIHIVPGEEVFFPVDPGTYTLQWSVPVDQDDDTGQSFIVSRDIQISAGEAPFLWVVPEEFRAFVQTSGEAPTELVQ